MIDERDVKFLKTNLQPFFWRKVEKILRKSQKEALHKFAFGSSKSKDRRLEDLEEKMQDLEEKMLALENKVNLKEANRRSESEVSEHQTDASFKNLQGIPKNDKIEIIQEGFRRNIEGKITLKNYYEGTEKSSLYELRGFWIKFDTIRRTEFYKKLKEEILLEE